MSDKDDHRTIVVEQNQVQIKALGIKQLCFGQKVIGSDGKAKINLIWKSQRKGPVVTIDWNVKYALNYTSTVPAVGLVVTVSGNWQACSLGGSYQINSDGFWESASGGKDDFLNITGNAYTAVYPIVGLWDASSQSYLPAYVDQTSLDTGGSSFYQPQSENDVWYAADVRTSQMIEGNLTRIAKFDTSKKNRKTETYVWKTSYEPVTGVWSGDNEPAAMLMEPSLLNLAVMDDVPDSLAAEDNVGLSFVRFVVRFDKQVPVTKWLKARAVVNAELEKKWGEPFTVKWLTEFLLEVKIQSKDGIMTFAFASAETPREADISAAIKVASDKGDIPSDDTFEVVQVE